MRPSFTNEMDQPLAERIDFASHQPHKVSTVICVRCFRRWVCIRPAGTLLKDLECPTCGVPTAAMPGAVIETGEVIQ